MAAAAGPERVALAGQVGLSAREARPGAASPHIDTASTCVDSERPRTAS